MNRCPSCKSEDFLFINNYENPFVEGELLYLYYCRGCTALFYNPFPSMNYAESFGRANDKFYFEYEAGLLFMISLIYPLQKFNFKNMVDIGCGLGFLMDMAREMLGVEEVLGIEPSHEGRAKPFDYTVINGYFPACIPDKGKKFDLIISSEVLEHVFDPKEFLHNIISTLSDSGFIVLTTPNADAFFQEDEDEKFAIVSPGQHTIISSVDSLSKALDGLGINYKIFLSEGKTDKKEMIVYLSKDKDSLGSLEYLLPVELQVLDFLDKYLVSRMARMRQGQDAFSLESNRWLYFGLLSRLIENRVNRGDYERCENLFNEMAKGLNDHYGLDIEELSVFAKNIKGMDDISFPKLMEAYPAFLSKFLYFFGMWQLNYKSDYVKAYELFSSVVDLSKTEQLFPLFYANKGIAELADKHRYIALTRELSRIGKLSEIEDLESLLEESNRVGNLIEGLSRIKETRS